MKRTERQIQKEKTKNLIMETAYKVFCEKGIINTRMSDIANEAGVSHGTVFLHFKTQEILIFEVISHYCKKIADYTDEKLGLCYTTKQFLNTHLDSIIMFKPFYYRLMTENFLLPVFARDEWINMQSIISHHFVNALDVDIKEGVKDIPLFFIYNTWIGIIHYYLANEDLFSEQGNVILENKQLLVENYLKLILNKK